MASEFQDGIPPIKGRENTVYFENGSPVNPDGWDVMKSVPEKVQRYGEVAISFTLVNATFNRLMDFPGVEIHSKIDRLQIFCRQNNLVFEEEPAKKLFILRAKK